MNLFNPYDWTPEHRTTLDRDGHLAFPSLLTDEARARLTESLELIHNTPRSEGQGPKPTNMYAAEYDDTLASVIDHPQMLELATHVLGSNIRYDHCVSLIRAGGNRGSGWHTHGYAEERPELGFIRIFFYVNGFTQGDGGLKAVPGSHHYRDTKLRLKSADNDKLATGWLAGKMHPETGEPLEVESLNAPKGTVVIMWTHAAHAVTPRKPGSDTRWCVVYAYRNPGDPSRARRISFQFEHRTRSRFGQLVDLY